MSSGLIQTSKGYILKATGGSLATDDGCCAESSFSCDLAGWQTLCNTGTPCGGLVRYYQLVDYEDGDILPCPTCENTAAAVWPGQFCADLNIIYHWFTHPIDSHRIAGKCLRTGTYSGAIYGAAGYGWQIYLRCAVGGGVYCNIWRGCKLHGVSPVGVYDRWAGYDTTEQLAIEEVP